MPKGFLSEIASRTESHIVGSAVQQCRSYEDRVTGGELSEFKQLSEVDRKKVLEKTFAELQTQTAAVAKHNNRTPGACLTMNVVCERTVYTANVGDSHSYLVVVDAKGNAKLNLLSSVHHFTQQAEIDRINADGVTLSSTGKLIGELQVTRSIGDRDHDGFGISHDPAITATQVPPLKKGEKAFVFNASDGLTDYLTQAALESTISRLFKVNPNITPETISTQLVRAAQDTYLASGKPQKNRDDISVVTIPILTSQSAYFGAVIDGHGGSGVADMIGEKLPSVLRAQTQQIIAQMSQGAGDKHPGYRDPLVQGVAEFRASISEERKQFAEENWRNDLQAELGKLHDEHLRELTEAATKGGTAEEISALTKAYEERVQPLQRRLRDGYDADKKTESTPKEQIHQTNLNRSKISKAADKVYNKINPKVESAMKKISNFASKIKANLSGNTNKTKEAQPKPVEERNNHGRKP